MNGIRCLVFGAAVLLLCGCASASRKKREQLAALRIYAQTSRAMPERQRAQLVFPRHNITFWVDPVPQLTETDLATVDVVEEAAGRKIRLRFNSHGAFVLENLTGGHRDRYIAVVISAGFLPPDLWPVAAIKVQRILRDGELVFLPNLSDEQIQQVVEALRLTIRTGKSRIDEMSGFK